MALADPAAAHSKTEKNGEEKGDMGNKSTSHWQAAEPSRCRLHLSRCAAQVCCTAGQGMARNPLVALVALALARSAGAQCAAASKTVDGRRVYFTAVCLSSSADVFSAM